MTLDPVSIALGVVATYAFSGLLLAATCVAESRPAKKERERVVDRRVADVAVRCIEHPIDARVN